MNIISLPGKKKAKKLFALIVLCLLLLNAFNGFSQHFYVGVNSGYNWGTPASGTLGTNYSVTTNTTSFSIVKGSFGKGIPVAVNAIPV